MIESQRGSITVEAALVFPFFIALILLLVNIINVAVVQIAMDHAVSETTKKIAAYSFPLKYIKQGSNLIRNFNGTSSTQLIPNSNIILNSWRDYMEEGASKSIETVIKEMAQNEIKKIYPLGNLDQKDKFYISDFKIYNPLQENSKSAGAGDESINNKDVKIVVDYNVKISIPFCPLKELKLQSKAMERAWVD